MPSVLKQSIKWLTVVSRTLQSVWPMMAISRPPLMAQASASERMVLLNGPVMMLPALRSQMKYSSGRPRTPGKKRFRRGVNAGQGDDRQFVGEIGDMDAGGAVAGNRAMVGIENGIK